MHGPRTSGESLPAVILLGASGHAKVVIELFAGAGRYRVAGCLDVVASGDVLGVPILGADDLLPTLHAKGIRHAFVAVGSNVLRSRLTARVRALGYELANAISPDAVISPSAVLGTGIAVMSGVRVNACAQIGDGVIINTSASIDHDCVVGDFAHCGPGVHLAGNVRIGEGALLGVGVSAIPSVAVGAWAIVGAGGAIVRDVPRGRSVWASRFVGSPRCPKRKPIADAHAVSGGDVMKAPHVAADKVRGIGDRSSCRAVLGRALHGVDTGSVALEVPRDPINGQRQSILELDRRLPTQ